MKNKKLMLIGILLIFAILATYVTAGIKDTKIFKFLKEQSGKSASWAAILVITALLSGFIYYNGIGLVLANPTVSGPNADVAIANAVNSFLYLLIPIYIIAFVITGLHFLFSQTPAGRATAKSRFFKLIISMGAVLIALPLFQLLLDVSQGIAQLIFSMGGDYVSIERVFGNSVAVSSAIAALFSPLPSGTLIAFLFFLLGMLTLIAIILILIMRYLIVVLAAIIFPFTLVLWLFEFPYTKHIGSKLMNHTIVWIFVPVITAVAVVFTSIIAGGFYEQCSALLILDPDCWLSYFAGLAATFLILAAPLMMYGIMGWLGATILFFGWTAMAAPLTDAGGLGPVGIRYFGFPGADTLLRIPVVEKGLEKLFGLSPLYGQDGRILGMTTTIEGIATGGFPLGAPPIVRFFKGITKGPELPTTEPLLKAVHYGKTLGYKFPFREIHKDIYNIFHPAIVIPKLGPLAVVAAGGVLAGMGPLGIVTAGLKGLWFEPGARFPLEAEIPLVGGGSMTVTAPKSLIRSYNPRVVLDTAPNAFKAGFPEEYAQLYRNNPDFLAGKMKVGSPADLSPPPMPPPQVPEAAAEEKRREKEREMIDEISVAMQKERDMKRKIPAAAPITERLEKVREIENRTNGELKKLDKKWGLGEKKIAEELERARTYRIHPEERKPYMIPTHWGAFGQGARILARQANLMHGLKAFKVYTPTPPKVPDWVRKQWEAEKARG